MYWYSSWCQRFGKSWDGWKYKILNILRTEDNFSGKLKKILNLCLRGVILRSYHFVAEVTFNIFSAVQTGQNNILKSLCFLDSWRYLNKIKDSSFIEIVAWFVFVIMCFIINWSLKFSTHKLNCYLFYTNRVNSIFLVTKKWCMS